MAKKTTTKKPSKGKVGKKKTAKKEVGKKPAVKKATVKKKSPSAKSRKITKKQIKKTKKTGFSKKKTVKTVVVSEKKKAQERASEKLTKQAVSSVKGEPKTMEELLEKTGYEIRGVKRGQLVEGTITDISRKMVLVDIGSKTEGLVVDKEYEAAKEFVSELGVGDKITVYVLTPENDRGQILLSLKKAATDRTWGKYEQAMKTGDAVNVKAIDANRGGVIVRADSLQGFIPSSQFGKEWLGKMDEAIERTFRVKVIEVNREKNRLIFSEKQVSEAEEIKQRSKALEEVKTGDVYKGVVSGIMPFGVFVGVDIPLQMKKKGERVGKVEGLVHISEISWEKVDDPNKHFKVGQKLEVKILGINEDSGKLNLSVKRLSDDPWDKIEKNYPQGKKFKGKVSRVAPFGVFVNLEAGIEGLLHISKIPSGEEPVEGTDIEVFVEQVDKEHRRMSLGKVLTEVPVAYK